ncbi:MAG: hypothetical protein VB035_06235 [Candidatus Fimivivens sp.]|nr:hypothetical protein [Candidatus Fimivivens sp.]
MSEFFANINYIEVVQWAGLLLLGAALSYYRTNAKLQQFVAGLIVQAEKKYTDAKIGGVKFAWVCGKIYSMIPAPLQAIVTRQMIETLVQGTFDAMAAYAKTQMDKLIDTAVPDMVHTEAK